MEILGDTFPNIGEGLIQPVTTSSTQQNPVQESVLEMSFKELFSSLTVRDIITPRPILIVNARENVASLLQRLRENKLRCAIVYDTERLYLGFVDAFDVVTHTLNVTAWNPNITKETFESLFWQAQNFAKEPSGSLINASNVDPFETISPDDRFRESVDIFARGVHRLAVVENGNIINILSQWDILMLILARVSFLGTDAEKTIEEAKLVAKDFNLLFSFPEENSVAKTLKYMYDHSISGVPLVDKMGRITHNFSLTDLLNLTALNYPLLTLSTGEFLTRVYGFKKPPVVCRRTDTVETVLLKFACYGVHRVYVVDEYYRAIAVITLTDIMQFLLRIEKGDTSKMKESE